MGKWGLTGATIVTPDETIKNAGISIQGDKIERVSGGPVRGVDAFDAGDTVLAPGLINAHDHLLGTYYPKVGNGPYENWLPWDNDLKSAPVYEERQQIENRDLYLLGAYRNLVSGVTIVSDHIPHFVSEPFLDMLPVKAIREYALAHSVASFALAWGDEIAVEYQKAIDKDIPFITHIAEGFDDETKQDLKTLERRGGLGDHSVLVHGIAFTESDIETIKKKGASVVWCGDSNTFMFNATANVKKMLEAGVNLCIGTDSPMSGGLNLLFEMKFDKDYYTKTYGAELSDERIVKMVTSNPAHAFKLKKNGHIKPGYLADFALFAKKSANPYSTIVQAEIRDVELVVVNGRPAFGSARFRGLFDSQKVACQEVTIDGARKLVVGDLTGLLRRINRAVGFKKKLPFLPVELDG